MITPWYVVVAGLGTETAFLIVALLGVGALLLPPFLKSYPALTRLLALPPSLSPLGRLCAYGADEGAEGAQEGDVGEDEGRDVEDFGRDVED